MNARYRGVITEFRRTLPPFWTLVVATGMIIATQTGVEYMRSFGIANDQNHFLQMRDAVLFILAIKYGFFRITAFSPVVMTSYRDWLMTTAWRWGKPLPKGPVQLIWQDALIVSVLTGIGLYDPFGPTWLIPFAFVAAYCFGSMSSFARERMWVHFYSIPLMLYVAIWTRVWFPIGESIVVVIYVWTLLGFRRLLRELPERSLDAESSWWEGWLAPGGPAGEENESLGFPFDFTNPKGPLGGLGRMHAFLLPVLLAGALGIIIAEFMPGTREQILRGEWQYTGNDDVYGVGFFILMAGLITAISYCGYLAVGCNPPRNIYGRIFALRLVLPRYDTIFLPIIMCIIGGSILFGLTITYHIHPFYAFPTLLLIMLWGGILGTPDRRLWRLTSHCIAAADAYKVQSGTGHKQSGKFEQ